MLLLLLQTALSGQPYLKQLVKENEAFPKLPLLEEKKLEGIPVRTLCERAGAARASFCRNYTSISDILHQECGRLIAEWGTAYESGPPSRPDNVSASLFDHYYKTKTVISAKH